MTISLFFMSVELKKETEIERTEILKRYESAYEQEYWEFSNIIDSSVNGEYKNKTNNIIIFAKDRTVQEVSETMTHELAHLIWFKKMNDSQRQEYEHIRNNSTFTVSGYANKNVKEDFAESVKHLIHREGFTTNFTKRYEFIENLLGEIE